MEFWHKKKTNTFHLQLLDRFLANFSNKFKVLLSLTVLYSLLLMPFLTQLRMLGPSYQMQGELFNLTHELLMDSSYKEHKFVIGESNLTDIVLLQNRKRCFIYDDNFWTTPCLRYTGKSMMSERTVQYFCTCQKPSRPILTLFTTMYENTNKSYIFRNTIRLWAKLVPKVQPVLFISPSLIKEKAEELHDLARYACSQGWSVIMTPYCNADGYPVLKSMFRTIEDLYRTPWIGYANGDILFNNSLTKSLEVLEKYVTRDPEKMFLVVGQRVDVPVSISLSYISICQKKFYLKILNYSTRITKNYR